MIVLNLTRYLARTKIKKILILETSLKFGLASIKKLEDE